jgi:hypothetical protein
MNESQIIIKVTPEYVESFSCKRCWQSEYCIDDSPHEIKIDLLAHPQVFFDQILKWEKERKLHTCYFKDVDLSGMLCM